jgi:hypothetical protein
MRNPTVPLEQRLRAAALVIPYTHAKPSEAPRVLEVVRTVVEEPRRNRALELTMRKYAIGLSANEEDEPRALTAQVVAPIEGPRWPMSDFVPSPHFAALQ